MEFDNEPDLKKMLNRFKRAADAGPIAGFFMVEAEKARARRTVATEEAIHQQITARIRFMRDAAELMEEQLQATKKIYRVREQMLEAAEEHFRIMSAEKKTLEIPAEKPSLKNMPSGMSGSPFSQHVPESVIEQEAYEASMKIQNSETREKAQRVIDELYRGYAATGYSEEVIDKIANRTKEILQQCA